MGADFVAAITKMPDLKEAALLHTFVDNLDGEQILAVMEECGVVEEKATEMMVGRLHEAIDIALALPRDCGTIVLDGTNYVMTGGMSWGDDPTESYELVWWLSIIQGFREDGF